MALTTLRSVVLGATAVVFAAGRSMPSLESALDTVNDDASLLEGIDHRPSLPPLKAVLAKASESQADFATQAAQTLKTVANTQSGRWAELANRKKDYETRLARQADSNRDVLFANEHIRKSISSMQSANIVMKKELQDLQKNNDILRNSALALQPKMAMAKEFLVELSSKTDPSSTSELEVLKPEKSQATLEEFLAVSHFDFGSIKKSAALLQNVELHKLDVETPVELPVGVDPPMKPYEFVQALSQSLVDLAQAEEEGEAQLMQMFHELYEEGDKKHVKLSSEQLVLNQTMSQVQKVRDDILKAQDTLKNQRQMLNEHLHGLRVFVRRVDRVVADAMTEAGSVPPPPPGVAAAPAKDAAAGVESKSQEAHYVQPGNEQHHHSAGKHHDHWRNRPVTAESNKRAQALIEEAAAEAHHLYDPKVPGSEQVGVVRVSSPALVNEEPLSEIQENAKSQHFLFR